MPIAVLTSFFGLCLVVSFISLRDLASPRLEHWLLFFYYVATKVRYYQGDYHFDRTFPKAIKRGTRGNQVVVLHLAAAVQFLFLACARLIGQPMAFFQIYAVTLGLNISQLIMQKHLLDSGHAKAKLVGDTLSRWIWINAFETVVALAAWLGLVMLPDIHARFPTLRQAADSDVVVVAAIVLFVIHLIDTFWNQDFLFPSG